MTRVARTETSTLQRRPILFFRHAPMHVAQLLEREFLRHGFALRQENRQTQTFRTIVGTQAVTRNLLVLVQRIEIVGFEVVVCCVVLCAHVPSVV
jgi:hypothetical protein